MNKHETIDEFLYRIESHGMKTEFREASKRLARSLQLPRLACFPITYIQFTDPVCLQEQILLKDRK